MTPERRAAVAKATKDRRAREPEREAAWYRKHNLKRWYGLTPEDVQTMIEFQAGLCAICIEPMVPGRGTCVDHDHTTRAIRGMLCAPCNRGLGQLQENALIVHGAESYLKGYENL